MFEIIRRLKPAYAAYNLFHRAQLSHNIEAYRELGLKKSYFAPVSSLDFVSLSQSFSKKSPYNQDIKMSPAFRRLSAENQNSVMDFEERGFAIIRGFATPELAENVNDEIKTSLDNGTIKFKYGNKIMFAISKSSLLRNIGQDPDLLELLSYLLGREAILFQSINFINGSEQRTHSDSIHMTTYPLGGLIACWLALEDIGPEQGPLHYYPGSHKLPYYLNQDYNNCGTALLTGSKTYSEYEDFIQLKIQEAGLKKEVFTASKGDLLIWHANLFHGGEPHANKTKTRKSMVFHYFSKGVVCYHEITQRPALLQFRGLSK